MPVISLRDFGMGKDTRIGVLCMGLLGIPKDMPVISLIGTLGWEKTQGLGCSAQDSRGFLGICLSFPYRDFGMGKDTRIGLLCMGLLGIPRDMPVISLRDFGMGKDTRIGVLCMGLLRIPKDMPVISLIGTLGWEKTQGLGCSALDSRGFLGIYLSFPYRDFGMGKDTRIGVLCMGLLGIPKDIPVISLIGTLGWEKTQGLGCYAWDS